MTSTLLLLLSLSASALRIAPAYHLSAAPTAAIARCRVATVCMADDDPDPKGVVNDASEKFSKSVSSVAESLSTLRIGKASASMLDRVMVDYYGAETPLNQLAMVTTPTATQLVVDPCALGGSSNHASRRPLLRLRPSALAALPPGVLRAANMGSCRGRRRGGGRCCHRRRRRRRRCCCCCKHGRRRAGVPRAHASSCWRPSDPQV